MKTTFLPSLLLIALIGILTGLVAGFVGYSAGRDIGTAISYDASFAVGYRDAFDRNRDDGFQQGYSDGLDEGLLSANTQVSNSQISAARNEGFIEGRQSGYTEGYNKGIEDGTLEGIKTGIDGFFNLKQSDLKIELERNGYVCSQIINTNHCEKPVSNNAQTGAREWRVFNLNNMTHTMYYNYTLDDGTLMKQQVIVDYTLGTISGEWQRRDINYTSPFLIYNFKSMNLIKNSTNVSDSEQTEFLMNWYNNWGDIKTIGDNVGITWVLSANIG
jgi:hypothetical protein